jgi:hypothetical protein
MRGLPELIAENEKAAKAFLPRQLPVEDRLPIVVKRTYRTKDLSGWMRGQVHPKRTVVQQERVRGRLLKTAAAAIVIGTCL